MTAPAAVFDAAGVPAGSNPTLALLALLRALHATSHTTPADVRALQAAVEQAFTAAPGAETVVLPLPLPREHFQAVMREPPPSPDSFLAALIGDSRAARLYLGAMGMDAPTRDYLAGQPDLVRTLARDHAGVIAAFGRCLRVANGRFVVPGGDEAVPLWESLVDARVAEPDEFIRKLIASRQGRLAYMLDTIAQLDVPHQRFVLGLSRPAVGRLDRLRVVRRAFTELDREWSFDDSPFGRPRHDAALLLRLVPVDERGTPTQPAPRAFWDAAFGGTDLPDDPRDAFERVHAGAAVDAARLVEQILLLSPPARRTRFETYAFGVRRFRQLDAATAPDAVVALRAFAAYPAVMLALERMGVASPSVFASAARACERLANIGSATRGAVAIAQFQGALAILDRVARTGRIERARVEALVTSLSGLELRDDRYAGRIAAWIHEALLPGILPLTNGGHDDGDDAELAILTAMADRSPDGDGKRVELEGLLYVVDVPAGDRARFEQVRERQGGERLDEVWAAARELRAKGEAARGREIDAIDRRLADVLIAIAYAPHQGEPADLFPAAAALFRRHDFGLDREGVTVEGRRRAPWERPRIADADGQTHVRGALLGLDLALARFGVRRLVHDRMPNPPRLNQNDRDALFETAALLNPRDLTDADMHAIATALGRGRERIQAVRADARSLDELAQSAGVSDTRRQALSWMTSQRSDTVEQVFTLAEVLRLGTNVPVVALDAWGTTSEPLNGCYCLEFPDRSPWENFTGRPAAGLVAARLPDPILRLAELLTEIGVPSALLPATFAYAAQDYVDEAPTQHVDDGAALVHQARTLTRVRVEDYLAAVAARGPLRPISQR
jgi:hypothetical protein